MRRRAYVSVEVDINDVLSELSDDDILAELSSREFQGAIVGDALEDLERALRRRDWQEVEHLLLTHVIPRKRAHMVVGHPHRAAH